MVVPSCRTSSPYGYIIAYGGARYYAHISSYPYIISYGDTFGVALFAVVVLIMIGRSEYGVLTYVYVIA